MKCSMREEHTAQAPPKRRPTAIAVQQFIFLPSFAEQESSSGIRFTCSMKSIALLDWFSPIAPQSLEQQS